MLLVLFQLFFTQIAQNSRIFSQARKQIIPVNSQLSTLSCDVAHRFAQIFTDLYSQTGRLLCIMNYALWIIVAHRFAQILKIYDSFRFKVQGYTLRVEI